MSYLIRTRVKALELKKITTSSKKDPNSDKILSTVVSLGWFVLFEGSYESLRAVTNHSSLVTTNRKT